MAKGNKNPYNSKATDVYSKSNIGGLKENVSKHSDKPYYFDKSNTKFFGSKVENVYADKNNTNYIFREKLTGSPDGKTKYKLGEYNWKNKTLKTSSIYDSKENRDGDFDKLKKGQLK